MELKLGALVSAQDGTRVGDLHGVIFDRLTGEVTKLIVDPSREEADFRELPIGAVDDADQREIFIALSPDGFVGLPHFAEVRNLAPPPVADNLSGQENREPDNVPDVPPVGAATGVESIAFTPILDESVRVSPEDSFLDASFTVRASDGDVGQVSAVYTDDQTNRITGLVVSRGIVFTHDVLIPAGWLRRIGPGWIGIDANLAAVKSRDSDEG